jgi:hypothetical protein
MGQIDGEVRREEKVRKRGQRGKEDEPETVVEPGRESETST